MRATAQAQPNIALVKYWGKRDVELNLPAVGSLSITLDSLWTRMSVRFTDQPNDVLEVNGAVAPSMLARVSLCLDLVAGCQRSRASVVSESNFPIAAGLASSASAFAALAVAANEAAGTGLDRQSLARLAGTVSGSAARSLYGGFVELTPAAEGVDVRPLCDGRDWPLEVIVAVTEEGPKAVGSGEAMLRSAETSPFYPAWVSQQDADMQTARDAVAAKDFAALAEVAEHNCLKMHSVMWSSRPPIVYWSKATLACMETIRSLQAAGEAVFFTIDAGPQVKAVCLPASSAAAERALQQTPGVIRTVRSTLGHGARLLDT